MLELTSTEVNHLSENTKVYEGVGKMYLPLLPPSRLSAELILLIRFMFAPIHGVQKRLESETTELKSDISNLNKKLHYLETTHKNSREHIDQIFKSSGR